MARTNFIAGIGAEAIREMLAAIDPERRPSSCARIWPRPPAS